MGAELLQQGCLRLNKEQGLIERSDLKLGSEYFFEKDRHRLYMVDTPLELVTDKWEAIAKIIITEITIGKGKTKGVFKVLKVFSDEESKIVSGTLIPYGVTR